MLNTTNLLIEALIDRIREHYTRGYGLLEPEYPNIAAWAARMSLENIANSDALYHNVEHTVMVTLVGQEILRGKHIVEGGVSPRDWLHFTISLLCHDIGYVRGVCVGDGDGVCATGVEGQTVAIPAGATDAAMTPYHIDRGTEFIHRRFGAHPILDCEQLVRNIEHTRFPVPDSDDYAGTEDYPGLLRSADLIGQLADPRYIHKLAALFYEFHETGTNKILGYENPNDLRDAYPGFFWNVVNPFVTRALEHLRITQEGQYWIANLYAHVFKVEHGAV